MKYILAYNLYFSLDIDIKKDIFFLEKRLFSETKKPKKLLIF